MNARQVSQITFLAIVVLFIILSFLVIRPFAAYIIFALVLAYVFYPVHLWLKRITKNETLSASILVAALLILLIIPTLVIITKLAPQASAALTELSHADFIEAIERPFSRMLGYEVSLEGPITDATTRTKEYVLKNLGGFITSASDVIIGLFVMFFTLFYALKKGPEVVDKITNLIPLKKRHRETVIQEIKRVTHAVLKGQVAIALIQGILGGIGFWAIGIPSPVFWGFVMTILSLLPVIGPPIVWLPAGIILISEGSTVRGILILVYGFFIISGIDNILKPRIVATEGKIHPVLALIGVLGGLKVFGFLGLILGPLVLAVTIALLKFLNEETREKKSRKSRTHGSR
jgi:predicted PurR-regulated permease PerM